MDGAGEVLVPSKNVGRPRRGAEDTAAGGVIEVREEARAHACEIYVGRKHVDGEHVHGG